MTLSIEIIHEKLENGILTDLPFVTQKISQIDDLFGLSEGRDLRPIVNFVNVQVASDSTKYTHLRDMLKMNINFVDGVGVFWRSTLMSSTELTMQTGPEVMELVKGYTIEKNAKVYFIGNIKTAKHYAYSKGLKYNDFTYYEPEFSDDADEILTPDLVTDINAKTPDLIIISLGGSKQTVFANLLYKQLNYSPFLILNVGAAMSKFGDRASGVSDFFKYFGIQTFLRLFYEPKKTFQRIFIEDIPWIFKLSVSFTSYVYRKYIINKA